MSQPAGMISHWNAFCEESMIFTRQTSSHSNQVPRGGALDTSWPQIPVAHLSFETDTHFSTIHCLNA
jgi:hypothetical protein